MIPKCNGMLCIAFAIACFFLEATSLRAQSLVDNTSVLVDDRDGKQYKIIQIGKQNWMAENLNYAAKIESWNYDDDSTFTENYGRLYSWESALKVCPAGWHLPDNSEWEELAEFINHNSGNTDRYDAFSGFGWWSKIGKFLKAAGTIESNTGLWGFASENVIGNNRFGFNALPGGRRTPNGEFFGKGDFGDWWSRTERGEQQAWYWSLSYQTTKFYNDSHLIKKHGFAVRCVKNKPAKND